MGTTLTGTTPQDTYDSLIKVTDNGPLSGTAKYLSDGLGNDSALAVSTGAAGVGTTTMARKFNIDGGSITSDTPTLRISSTDGSGTRKFGIEFYSNSGADVRGKLLADNSGKVYLDDNGGGGVVLQANGGTGNVGIGTSAPTTLGAGITSLDVAGSAGGGLTTRGTTVTGELIALDAAAGFYISTKTNHPIVLRTNDVERVRVTNNGLTFNGDTAAANALDDYEEGTFTPTFVPTSGAFDSITYTTQYGKYTKIGNRVDINIQISCAAVSLGTAGGVLTIANLPYVVGAKVCPVSLMFVSNWPTDRYPIRAAANDGASNILLRYVTALNANETYLAGTDIQAGSEITISGTYFI